ncbi:MAG TPA: hypothetical protein VFH43_07350, partial [Candidatus Kapabacteria bacterium]|nr:hypothetical protein [Candidatus Kapabacteria bacterium]
GGPYVLQVAEIPKIIEAEKPRVIIVAETLDQVYGLRSPLASQSLLKWIKNSELPFNLYLIEAPATAALSRFRRSYRSLEEFELLRNAKLFLAPNAGNAEEETQNNILRLEKLIQDAFTVRKESAATV